MNDKFSVSVLVRYMRQISANKQVVGNVDNWYWYWSWSWYWHWYWYWWWSTASCCPPFKPPNRCFLATHDF